jgi:hypothetical protein
MGECHALHAGADSGWCFPSALHTRFLTLFRAQVLHYFRTFPQDRRFIKLVVVFAVFVDTLGTMNNCACVYLVSCRLALALILKLTCLQYTITHWGDPTFLLVQGWTIPSYLILSNIPAFVVQLFLTWRFWNLCVFYTPLSYPPERL